MGASPREIIMQKQDKQFVPTLAAWSKRDGTAVPCSSCDGTDMWACKGEKDVRSEERRR